MTCDLFPRFQCGRPPVGGGGVLVLAHDGGGGGGAALISGMSGTHQGLGTTLLIFAVKETDFLDYISANCPFCGRFSGISANFSQFALISSALFHSALFHSALLFSN